MSAGNPLPMAVNAVGDRINLNYNIKRKEATEAYVQANLESRLELSQLKNSYYTLNELKTRKNSTDSSKTSFLSSARNPLKLNARIRKKLYKISPEDKLKIKYADFVKINKLWQQYATKVIENCGQAQIFKTDLHGCKLKCVASKNPTLIDKDGIVVQETKNTFLIITSTDRLVTLPKKESEFDFELGSNRYRIHGCNLLLTIQTRSKQRVKALRSQLI